MVRVLVVDDDSEAMDALVGMLTRAGYDAQPAAGGSEAVDAARQGAADLMLMDCHQRDMDGFTALRTIKEHADTTEMPVIMLAGDDTGDITLACGYRRVGLSLASNR